MKTRIKEEITKGVSIFTPQRYSVTRGWGCMYTSTHLCDKPVQFDSISEARKYITQLIAKEPVIKYHDETE